MAEDDCGATFALPMSEDIEIIPVTIDVTDDAMAAMGGVCENARSFTIVPVKN